MDVTTVNDRHLYEGRILVRDPENSVGQIELAARIIRFGPAGWITVVDDLTAGAEVVLYPTSQVLSVSALREVGGDAISSSASR
jgi:hypothetical protein